REWRSLKRNRALLLPTVVGYLPVIIAAIFTLYLMKAYSLNSSFRTSNALPWSYADYLGTTHPDQIDGLNSYAVPITVFQRDFGKLDGMSITQEWLAMLRKPAISIPFLGYNSLRLCAAIGASFLETWRWQLTPYPGDGFGATPNASNLI